MTDACNDDIAPSQIKTSQAKTSTLKQSLSRSAELSLQFKGIQATCQLQLHTTCLKGRQPDQSRKKQNLRNGWCGYWCTAHGMAACVVVIAKPNKLKLDGKLHLTLGGKYIQTAD